MTHPIANSIALLIDADNAPAAKIEFILSELAAHGVVNILKHHHLRPHRQSRREKTPNPHHPPGRSR